MVAPQFQSDSMTAPASLEMQLYNSNETLTAQRRRFNAKLLVAATDHFNFHRYYSSLCSSARY